MNYRTISDLSKVISGNLHLLTDEKFDLIVSIPRSGVLAGSMIALKLNLPLTTFKSFIDNKPLESGIKRKVGKSYQFPHEAKKVLIVDDSIQSGESILKIKEEVKAKHIVDHDIKFLAVYSGFDHSKTLIDFTFEKVARPRFFEWNVFHHEILKKSCVDIDGVLCLDPQPGVDDDGDQYLNFLSSALPLYLPTVKVGALVTNRLEKYKEQTEAWLIKNGVEYSELCLNPANSNTERRKLNNYASHKANVYLNSGCSLFIESDKKQAVEICKISGLPVLCIESNELYNPSSINKVIRISSYKRNLKNLLVRIPIVLRTYKYIQSFKKR